MRALIGAGADIEAKDDAGWTASMWATYRGHGACVKLLIGAGADLEAKDKDGRCAAMLAAQNGHARLSRLIREIRLSRSEAEKMRQETGRAGGMPG